MQKRERGGKKRRRGGDGTRGKLVWGKSGEGREGHEETSRTGACSEDVQFEVRVLHDLHRAVIGRQPRIKRLTARQCAADKSGLYVSEASLELILQMVKKSLVGNRMEGLPPGNQLRLQLRCQ